MRSKTLILALAAAFGSVASCGGTTNRNCSPVPSFSGPVGECVAVVEAPIPTEPMPTEPAPAEPAPAEPPPPPPAPEPEPEPKPEPPPPPSVAIADDKIELDRTIQFRKGKTILIEDSRTLLDDVVKLLQEHPELLRIRIEGHTDSVGRDRANQKLSERRANAVKQYLIKAGIKKQRLIAKGYGETKPIADNDTEEGRFKNRRVDLTILKRDDTAAPRN